MKSYQRLLLALSVLFLLPAMCLAQTATTSVQGTVTDAQGAVVAGATVTVAFPAIGFTQAKQSSSDGAYSFKQIPPGRYVITVTAPGFGANTSNVELLVNQPSTVNVKMTVSESTTVNVESAAPVINTVDATIGTPFDSAQIQTLPFSLSNINDLLALQPGVVFLGSNTETSGSDTRNGSVNGARSDQNNITLDGLDNNIPNKGYAFNGALRATRDSLEEFRVVTTNSNADSGHSSGAQISMVTRRGTNTLHGSLYYYYRPTNTVANDFFNKKAQLTAGNPNRPVKFIRNLYGGSLGAPILHDKLFFFGAYEGRRDAVNSVSTDTVPETSFAAGSLKYTNSGNTTTTLAPSDLAAIDPNCTGNGTCPLGPGANPAVLAYFALYPGPNSTVKGDNFNTSGYTFTSPNPTHLSTTILRLDYALSARHSLFVRGNLQDDHTIAAESFPGNPPSSKTYDDTKGFAAGDTWIISPSLVNNLRYGFTRPSTSTSGNITSQYVSFSVTPLASNSTSSISILPMHNIVDDIAWTKGKHNLQFGVDYRAIFDNHSSNNTIFNNATVSTGNLVAGGIANTGSSLDPGAFGYPHVASGFTASYNTDIADITGLITMATAYANYSIGSGGTLTPLPAGQVPNRHFFSNELEYYAQDAWKITPKLTLTFGFRHTLLQVPYERNKQEVIPTFSLNNWFAQRVAAARAGGVNQPNISFSQGGQASGKKAYWSMDKLDIAPRFAFAWSPNSKLSVRGGYGLYYDHFGDALVDALDQRGSFGLSSTLSNGASQYVDTAPRFSTISGVPSSLLPPITNPGSFPVTPPIGSGLTAWVLDDKIKTPYAHVIDLSVQQQLTKGLVFELDYTGRLGRRLMQQLDLAEPLDVVDPASGMDYYTAGTMLSKYVDQGITAAQAATIPTIPYFDNEFPLLAGGGLTATQNLYKTKWVTDRGNETEAIFELDTPTTPGGSTPITPGSAGGALYRFFNQQYVNLVGFTSIGTSSYHSLQANLHHPMSHGFQFDIDYTFSKSLDEGSDGERVASANSRGYGQIISSFNPKLNKAVSDFDVRHNLSVDMIGNLPFGTGKAILGNSNRLVDMLIGHWTITGVVHATSGLPFAAYDGKGWSTNFDVRSWMVAKGPITSGGHAFDSKGNPNAFGTHAAAALANLRLPYPGETGERNFFRGDGYFSLDTGVDKVFPITRTQQVKFAWEVLNATNTNRFDAKSVANNANTSSTFGEYSSLINPQSYRNMQFSLRYSF